MNITVAGVGYVGLVVGVCMAEAGHKVICIDVDKTKIDMLCKGCSPIYEDKLEELIKKHHVIGDILFTTDASKAYKGRDAIFIGVGTPEGKNGATNLEYVESVVNSIVDHIDNDAIVVIKSTVPIGTCDKIDNYIQEKLGRRLDVVSNPEFLAQGSAVENMRHPYRVVIGSDSCRAVEIINKIYAYIDAPIVEVSRKSAELTKYACNDFLALKIAYINEIANLCEKVGADIEEVVKGMSYDDRIGDKFLKAGVGYGGSCFPKDTKALSSLAKEMNCTIKTIDATIEANEEQSLVLYNKAINNIGTFKDKNIAILGMTFKPGTDDIRSAPAFKNVIKLLEDGAYIKIYDPIVSKKLEISCMLSLFCKNSDKIYVDRVSLTQSIEEALKDADLCFIFTEWQEFINMEPKVYIKCMKNPLVYDGRNIYDYIYMKEKGIEYYSIGRR